MSWNFPEYSSSATVGWWRVALVGLLLLLGWELSAWDQPIAAWFGNAEGFAWRDRWLTAGLAHRGGRMLAGVVLVVLAINAWRPLWAGVSARRARWAFAATVLCLLLIPLLKRGSATSCPWDLQQFGGMAVYVPHWSWVRGDGGPGHCFPSGHASAAFAFLSTYFMFRPRRPMLARWSLALVLVLGLTYGLAQLARGAHFPSHTLWTAWICWVVCGALMGKFGQDRDARQLY
ncbi:phosphatase PAP2 family protein [Roseateles sp. BYS180W]|uniref:Phosphatase PAP2 family protein n=1 Tax=Roseateles rivi TaxID=3299028 RepID=A0ABW7FTL5_9BURK